MSSVALTVYAIRAHRFLNASGFLSALFSFAVMAICTAERTAWKDAVTGPWGRNSLWTKNAPCFDDIAVFPSHDDVVYHVELSPDTMYPVESLELDVGVSCKALTRRVEPIRSNAATTGS